MDAADAQSWNSRRHFFSAAAEAMRRILIEKARHKRTLRAGGETNRVDFGHFEPAFDTPGIDILALNQALEELQQPS